jgi:hypothetical protein
LTDCERFWPDTISVCVEELDLIVSDIFLLDSEDYRRIRW